MPIQSSHHAFHITNSFIPGRPSSNTLPRAPILDRSLAPPLDLPAGDDPLRLARPVFGDLLDLLPPQRRASHLLRLAAHDEPRAHRAPLRRPHRLPLHTRTVPLPAGAAEGPRRGSRRAATTDDDVALRGAEREGGADPGVASRADGTAPRSGSMGRNPLHVTRIAPGGCSSTKTRTGPSAARHGGRRQACLPAFGPSL